MDDVMQPTSIGPRGSESRLADSSSATFEWRDWIGIVASIGCAIHCAAMPFVIAFLPALGLSFLADEGFHRWMALACFVIALAAFVPGFRKHRRWTPGAIAIVGLSLITFAAFGFAGDCCAACESPAGTEVAATACADACCEHCAVNATAETKSSNPSSASFVTASVVSPNFLTGIAPWITPLGGILLVSAHLLNRRYGCLCGCCEAKPATKVAE
ncbi:MerC domain-containing protein [Rosistilla oblonga]|uniref:MerC mercury resistance protein n=1 Tax=Rosistilla oblonga TaxID=2527990 RepID=A0A518J048_9BACT|nr:MerC domain-containing protein [Rosistilla oblonga]QDV58723.1 MerC mercury resistance protein [Rosistilla oblonga]